MNRALEAMLARYPRSSADEWVSALREVLQSLVLLGLWRGKFFQQAAFYGGTALRLLYGLDRYSEDIDFSLLHPDPAFTLDRYLPYVQKELSSWGFTADVRRRRKTARSAVESAFAKADTSQQLLVIEAASEVVKGIHPGSIVRVKFEVDTDPPRSFATETRFCLQPLPFSVLAYTEPSLFAGKMHALLCRAWRNRVKGRDWYDLVWFAGRGTGLDLRHLEARMRQTGHWQGKEPLAEACFRKLLEDRIDGLDVEQARADVVRFLQDPSAVAVWSCEFFHAVARRVEVAAQ